MKSIRDLPGPKGLPILGSLTALTREPVPFFLNVSREYGALIPIKLGLSTAILLNSPDVLEHVLQRNYQNYRKTRLVAKLQPIMGTGLVTSDGELWAAQRRLMQPSFHRRKIEGIFGTMQETISKRTEIWQRAADSGEVLNVARDMAATTLEVAVKTMFGADIDRQIDVAIECIEFLQVETPKRVFALTPLREVVPNPARSRFNGALRQLDEIVYEIIRRRRAVGSEEDDLLSLLMAARDEETNREMTDRQLRDEVITVFAAGHETTANAMTWIFSLLSDRPDVRDALIDEIQGLLGHGQPSVEGLGKMPLTTSVINEALRLYPPIWWTSRVNIDDDELAGYKIPQGTIVLVCPWTIQRHPAVWEAPDEFQPWRFLPENTRGRHKFAFLPFGAGPRACIGSGFAMMEMKLVLSNLLPKFRFERCAEVDIEPGPYLTMKPRRGLPMRIRAWERCPQNQLSSAA